MAGHDSAPPLPWLDRPLQQALGLGRAHALLLHGPEGVGQFELALAIAQAWLCETGTVDAGVASGATSPACGQCASCHLVQARSHPDLLVLLPETMRETLGWGAETSDGGEGAERGEKSGSKAKPSKEIKVNSVRALVAFTQTTTARGHGKAVVVHPAERMNAISANTLLKTLEEPPGGTRFVLSTAAPHLLLPTIRSRCQAQRIPVPPTESALAWLAAQGLARAEVLLAGAGGQPQQARDWAAQGMDAAAWLGLPEALRQGDAAGVADWPLPLLIDALQRLCHDALCVARSAAPRYFPRDALGDAADARRLLAWAGALRDAARHAEHPWHPALMLDSLVHQARIALAPPPRPASVGKPD